MRAAVIAVVLVGCGTAAKPAAPPAPIASSAAPPVVAVGADAGAPAPPAVIVEEAPLAWGTRPNKEGPLYPVIDGMCIHAEAWPLENDALLSWGNSIGRSYASRGGAVTLARFTDDGLDLDVTKTTGPAKDFAPFGPMLLEGRWPGPLMAWSEDFSGGRFSDAIFSYWTHDDAGWTRHAVSTELGDPRKADYLNPAYFQGHVIVPRVDRNPQVIRPIVHYKAFPPLPALAAFDHEAEVSDSVVMTADDEAIYAVSTNLSKGESYLREWRDGKVKETKLLDYAQRIALTKPVVLANEQKIQIYRDGKMTVVAPRLAKATKLTSIAVAPSGDLWVAEAFHTAILIVHPDGKIETRPIPAPKTPRVPDQTSHTPFHGGDIAGVELDDPYVIGQVGTLFHWVNGAFEEVTLPPPPWSTNRYRAESIAMKQKGDLYVNAAYGEKGIGWSTAERYRAILRVKRPREVLRCNEPKDFGAYAAGRGFMSFPPLAGDTCTTPFAVLLRTAYDVNSPKTQHVVFDEKAQFPGVRAAFAATPELGAGVALVDFTSGDQRYLGAAMPSVAAGRAFLTNLGPKVQAAPGSRAELVCGVPPNASRRLSLPASAEAGSTRH